MKVLVIGHLTGKDITPHLEAEGRQVGVLRAEGRIALVYPERELIPPPVRAFVDWMVARAPTALPRSSPRRRSRT